MRDCQYIIECNVGVKLSSLSRKVVVNFFNESDRV